MNDPRLLRVHCTHVRALGSRCNSMTPCAWSVLRGRADDEVLVDSWIRTQRIVESANLISEVPEMVGYRGCACRACRAEDALHKARADNRQIERIRQERAINVGSWPFELSTFWKEVDWKPLNLPAPTSTLYLQ